MRLRAIILTFCVLSLSILIALPARAQYPVQPVYPGQPAFPEPEVWGAPQFQVWPTGYFIWMDNQGFHLRWNSAPGQSHRFYGQATVQGGITYFQPVYPNRPGAPQRQGNRLIWDAYNAGGGDGFNLGVNQGGVVYFSLQVDGRMAYRTEIYLGASGFNPSANPFALRASGPAGVFPQPPVGPVGPVGQGIDIWGAPQFQVWPMGYFIWLDERGFHVRWTSVQGQRHRFNGDATIQGSLVSFQPVYTRPAIRTRRLGNTISWADFNAGGGGEGFDFVMNQGDRVRFSLLIDGRTAYQGEIYLGARAFRPSGNPFWLRFSGTDLRRVIEGPEGQNN